MVRALGGGRGAGAHAGTPSSQLPQGRGQGAARTARGEEGADGRAVTLARSLPPRAQRAAGGGGGGGGAAPAGGGGGGGGPPFFSRSTGVRCMQALPTPDPSPPFA